MDTTKEKIEKRRGEFGSSVRSVDKATRTVTFVASSAAIDSYGESINQSGWDLTRFLAHPVIPFGHDYYSLPVGKATRVEVVAGKLECDIQLAPADANPIAENIWQCLVNGVPLGVSVGFMPTEWHYEQTETGSMRVYDKQELLEISIVTIPSNPEALQKTIVDGIRSTKAERRERALAALELLTRAFSVRTEADEPDDEEEPAPEPEVVPEPEEHATLKAYRKLVPALRGLLNAAVKENELEQIAEIREALAARRDAEPEEPEAEPEPEIPDAGEATPAETPAEAPAEAKPAEPEPEIPVEPELDAEDEAAIADAVAEKLTVE